MSDQSTPPSRDTDFNRYVKMTLLALVVTAGVLKARFHDGHPVEIACEVVVAVGAAFGIASGGIPRR